MAAIGEVIKTVGLPLAAVWVYAKYLAPKPNGKELSAITEHLNGLLGGLFKEADYRSDLDRTKHFEQLRRDLKTTIEDAVESKLSAYFLQMELDRLRKQAKR